MEGWPASSIDEESFFICWWATGELHGGGWGVKLSG